MIAVVASAANSCDYCVNHHSNALNHYWKDKERLGQLNCPWAWRRIYRGRSERLQVLMIIDRGCSASRWVGSI
ncbi:MAG: carboxymuconolactone decarboxylase family protein [Candidatus Glassbacteria bacterium]